MNLRLSVGDGGLWLRQQYIIMSENTHTPIAFWVDMRLTEFRLWVDASNKLQNERMKKRKKK